MPRPKNPDKTYQGHEKTRKEEITNIPVRVGGRLKKAKVVFDPSDNILPRRTRSLSSASRAASEKSVQVKGKQVKKNVIANTSVGVEEDQPPNNAMKTKKKVLPVPVAVVPKCAPVLEPQGLDICSYCLKYEHKKNQKLVFCKDCNYKIHSKCLKINFKNPNLLEEHWRCKDCTSCVICYETREAGQLITCCMCVDSYHINCLKPRIADDVEKQNWECSKCQNINRESKNSYQAQLNHLRDLTHPTASTSAAPHKSDDIVVPKRGRSKSNAPDDRIPVKQLRSSQPAQGSLKESASIAPHATAKQTTKQNYKLESKEVPDVSDWSCEKVTSYVGKYFPDEARIFKEQEIDGPSLKLMKRTDIVGNMPMKLGPAIKLYSLILKLQTRSRDPTNGWM